MRTTKGSLSVPAAIIVAGTIIAAALLWIYRPVDTGGRQDRTMPASASDAVFAPISSADHILGNPDASVKLVEYSDLSCPYCQVFNPTIEQIMADYGPSGKVAWVYRSFPLMKPAEPGGQAPHPNSGTQAEALECVARQGGDTAFFAFEKKWFETFPADAATRSASDDRAQIDSVVSGLKLDKAAFDDCMDKRTYSSRIEADYQAGLDAGITGTPTTVIFTPSGSQIPMPGAQSYTTIKNALDALLPSSGSTTGL